MRKRFITFLLWLAAGILTGALGLPLVAEFLGVHKEFHHSPFERIGFVGCVLLGTIVGLARALRKAKPVVRDTGG